MIKIPDVIKGQKVTITSEVFVIEISKMIDHLIRLPHLRTYNTTQRQIFADEYAARCFTGICKVVKNLTPDTPEKI